MTREQRAQRRQLAGGLIGFLAGLTVVLVLFLLIRINAIADQNAATIARIDDCTIKGGKCYAVAAERNRVLIQVLTAAGVKRRNFVVTAIACADRPGTQTVASIRACAEGKATP